MVWYSHLLKNFPHFVVIHIVKGFGIVNKAEVDVFLEPSCFFYIKIGWGVIFAYVTCLGIPLSFIIKQIPILVIFHYKNHEVFYCTLKFQQQ